MCRFSSNDVVAFVIDHVIGAGFFGSRRLLVRIYRRNHARAATFCELNGIGTDGSRPSGHRDSQSGDWPIGEHAAMGRHHRDTKARAVCEANVVRKSNNSQFGQRDVFRAGTQGPLPLRFIHPYPIANSEGAHIEANSFDNAGAVLVRNYSWV